MKRAADKFVTIIVLNLRFAGSNYPSWSVSSWNPYSDKEVAENYTPAGASGKANETVPRGELAVRSERSIDLQSNVVDLDL